MAIEIERKYLLADETWKTGVTGMRYTQGYITSENGRTVRVRLAGSTGFITVKGPTVNSRRLEYEYVIPEKDAREMLQSLCVKPLIDKYRYKIEYHGFIWEIDEFEGENSGLTLAEIELDSIDQPFDIPPWVGEEVTDNPRYYNASLAKFPFSKWKDEV